MTKEFKKGKIIKARWDLLPIEAIEEVVNILTQGAEKYDDWNWLENEKDWHYAALLRHLVEWKKGEIIDKESKKHHLAHVICNAIFCMELDRIELLRDIEEEDD